MALQPLTDHDLLGLLELTEDAASLSLEAYLERTLLLCAEWFQASGATLFLRDSEEYALVARAGSEARAPLGARIHPGSGIAGTAISKGEPMLLRDPMDHVLLEDKALRTRPEIGSSLVVPLKTRQMGPLGVLCLSRRAGEREFSKKDLSAAKALAGQIALAVSNARLLSQSLAAEKELGEAKRMAEVGQMTAAIAHEIRNPLTGIRSAAQMVVASGGESAEFGQIVIEETDKLDRLCGEFLEFARPFELTLYPTDLRKVLEKVAALEAPSFEAAGVRLALESPLDVPILKLDSRRMEQVCRNLLRNALHASAKGGRVTLEATPDGMGVSDEGEGMTREQLEVLFTPFFTTKPQGTGLGMSVVKKIVEAHGGTIQVRSALGEGTTVRVRLPVEKT